jgi:hypothetical protein
MRRKTEKTGREVWTRWDAKPRAHARILSDPTPTSVLLALNPSASSAFQRTPHRRDTRRNHRGALIQP